MGVDGGVAEGGGGEAEGGENLKTKCHSLLPTLYSIIVDFLYHQNCILKCMT